jgi:hypothetical protein
MQPKQLFPWINGTATGLRRFVRGCIPGPSVRAPWSMKSGLLQSFKHMVSRLLRAELIGERPGIEEWP